MRETTSEIKKVFDKHHYSIDTIVFDVMQTFKLHSIVRHTRFEKQEGYPATEVLALLLMFHLMMLRGVNSFFYRAFSAVQVFAAVDNPFLAAWGANRSESLEDRCLIGR